jgi:hypothetical protein
MRLIRAGQVLQLLSTVTPVVALTSVEHAAVTFAAGTVTLIGNGTLGSAGSRSVTVEVMPAAVMVVDSDSGVRPVQVTVPVTETDELSVLTLRLPVHDVDTDGWAAWRSAAFALVEAASPSTTAPQATVAKRAR